MGSAASLTAGGVLEADANQGLNLDGSIGGSAVHLGAGGQAITLTGDLAVTSGSGGIHFGGPVDADDASAHDRSLTLDAGTGGTVVVSGAVGANEPLAGLTLTQSNGATFSEAVAVSDGAGTITLSDTTDGQRIAFEGAVTAEALSTASQGYDLALLEGGTITADTTFANTGDLTLGDGAGDSTTFAGGLDTTAVTNGTTAAGTLATTGTAMDLGAVTLVDDKALTLTTGAGGGDLTVASITGNASGSTENLTLISGSGTTLVAGPIGTGIGTLTLQEDAASSTGAVHLQGDVSANALTTFSQGYDLTLLVDSGSLSGGETLTLASATAFANTGSLTLGDEATDHLDLNLPAPSTFEATVPSSVQIAGSLVTTGDAVMLGDSDTAVTLGASTTIDTSNGGSTPGGAAITFGSTLDGTTEFAESLTLTAGAGTIDMNGAVGAGTALGDVTVVSAGNLTADAAFSADTFTQQAGSGTTTFGGTLTLQSDFNLTGTNLVMDADGSTVDGFRADTSSTIDFQDDLTVSGTLDSGSPAGALVLTSADIDLSTAAADLATTAGGVAGLVDLNLDGSGGLTLVDGSSITTTATADGTVSGAIEIASSAGAILLQDGAQLDTSGKDNASGTAADGGAVSEPHRLRRHLAPLRHRARRRERARRPRDPHRWRELHGRRRGWGERGGDHDRHGLRPGDHPEYRSPVRGRRQPQRQRHERRFGRRHRPRQREWRRHRDRRRPPAHLRRGWVQRRRHGWSDHPRRGVRQLLPRGTHPHGGHRHGHSQRSGRRECAPPHGGNRVRRACRDRGRGHGS